MKLSFKNELKYISFKLEYSDLLLNQQPSGKAKLEWKENNDWIKKICKIKGILFTISEKEQEWL